MVSMLFCCIVFPSISTLSRSAARQAGLTALRT